MKKILIVVDYQFDFVDPHGALPVLHAIDISKNIQKRIDSGDYSDIIYTFDTHTKSEYDGSEEQKLFPNIHCEYGTDGWKLCLIKPQNKLLFDTVVNASDKPYSSISFSNMGTANEHFFTKNVFDIWAGNANYPKWFEKNFPKDEYEVDVVGVATNYCVKMNIMGMVERGYKINIISDAVKGIQKFPDGSIDESFEQNNTTMREAGVTFK